MFTKERHFQSSDLIELIRDNKPLTERLLSLYHLLTVDLFSVYLLSRVGIVIRYIEVDFTFGLPDYVRYIEEFVISRFLISRFYSIHFTVTLAGT